LQRLAAASERLQRAHSRNLSYSPQVSASKFDVLMGKLGSPLSAGDEVSSPLNLIEYLNLNAVRLSDILQKVSCLPSSHAQSISHSQGRHFLSHVLLWLRCLRPPTTRPLRRTI
jgi:hypothetical protein